MASLFRKGMGVSDRSSRSRRGITRLKQRLSTERRFLKGEGRVGLGLSENDASSGDQLLATGYITASGPGAQLLIAEAARAFRPLHFVSKL